MQTQNANPTQPSVKLTLRSCTQEILLKQALEDSLKSWSDGAEKFTTPEERKSARYNIQELSDLIKQLTAQGI